MHSNGKNSELPPIKRQSSYLQSFRKDEKYRCPGTPAVAVVKSNECVELFVGVTLRRRRVARIVTIAEKHECAVDMSWFFLIRSVKSGLNFAFKHVRLLPELRMVKMRVAPP